MSIQKKSKITISEILSKKKNKEKITMLTSYDYCLSRICNETNLDMVLIGDSAATVMMGYNSTRKIGMTEMLTFCKGVVNAITRQIVIADMPFGSYQMGKSISIKNALKFLRCGCDAVKLEGGLEIVNIIKNMTDLGIPVMGHIGLKPQTTPLHHGYISQGKTAEDALKLLNEAKVLEEAGVFSIVLEKVTSEVASVITQSVNVPTIGIGCGPHVDGQVLVTHDMLGLYKDFEPKFVKRYLNLSEQIFNAIEAYETEVKSGKFPQEEHMYHMTEEEFAKLERMLKRA
ncbi:MAG: 3-methyl-2-oxobutanoate hydroxymethyltransferase [Nitrososphaeraceae archaeon]|jgi:3-methyl-2-oxobutanoate hydroxymethyltransferase|nr:3-methyl-2-oxobutanoate hydroxymethyltransferase [Nitrososphaeraceae archaeon]